MASGLYNDMPDVAIYRTSSARQHCEDMYQVTVRSLAGQGEGGGGRAGGGSGGVSGACIISSREGREGSVCSQGSLDGQEGKEGSGQYGMVREGHG